MSLEPERRQELDQAWMDSLLTEALCIDAKSDDQRVDRLFDSIRLGEKSAASTSMNESQAANRKRMRWLSFAMAASLFMAVGFWSMMGSSSQQAAAAVAKALKATPPTREYSIRIHARRPKRDVENRATLFLDDQDRFVLHYPGWSGFADLWIGGAPNRRWIVPRLGPVLVGNESLIGNWMAKKDATSPYLHLQPVLKRMEKAYDLRMLEDEHLVRNEVDRSCQVVEGTLRQEVNGERRGALPVKIKLWADRESGVAEKLVLNWDRAPDRLGPLEWTIQLEGTPVLDDHFFDVESHVSTGRRVRMIQGSEELDQFVLE